MKNLNLGWKMEPLTLKWSFFVLFLVLVHFYVVTWIAGLLGIFQPAGLFLVGAAWVWFAMPRVNSWLVIHTPFGRVWAWFRP